MKPYYPELDGVRGIAALMVFFSHVIGLLPETEAIQYLQHSPFRVFWDGAAAVDLFFVLSGFVLALPFVTTETNPNYWGYAVRRMFRLYPAYWIALAVAIVLRSYYDHSGMVGLSEWAQKQWTDPITFEVIARHATLLLQTNTHAIDPVAWSLIAEMRMSLILPLIIYVLNRLHGPAAQSVLLVVTFSLAMAFDQLAVFPLFVMGSILAKNFSLVTRLLMHFQRQTLGLLILIAVWFYGNRWLFPFELEHGIQSYLTAIASLFFIAVAANSARAKLMLKSRLFQFLGKTSYSFYLLHLPVLLLITAILYPTYQSMLLCTLIALTISYMAAFIISRYIEYPAIQMGKIIAARVSNATRLAPTN